MNYFQDILFRAESNKVKLPRARLKLYLHVRTESWGPKPTRLGYPGSLLIINGVSAICPARMTINGVPT